MSHKKKIAEGIRMQRARVNISQDELARRAGVAPASISAYECEASVPSLEAAIKLADALGCTVNDLCGYREPVAR